ncbi:DUF4190 domain-containing protein [Clavibacter sepedonicus]|uniref:Membrane protein n=1 Tax=Clavibacter sepedonicus TaxID=31964 RepID=B0RCA7_CLASE|nr:MULTISPECIES: DUF4190 domain-containing protein [Clavibacter]MBD5382968.1 DUF4190 domain-containing protein [Clavibacter sp.]OQJ48502.1 hypothetical protein B5P19_09705 [Clavibacter sepedonicus]OQJ53985.1 hypothetical protein B5P20_07550 [Clavibacter sepedonicus]UUK65514.1 DUF4190 domain-containing protein [Clavibacter sepedonicus]CAQ02995.1 putative membrane protein [Clavibacter sepedonicus]
MTFRYAPEPEPTAPRERKSFNGVGLAALIVGVLSLVGSVIPILNYVSGFLAVVGIVLGIVGLILRDRPKGMAFGGLILSVVALILSIVLAIVYTAGIVTAITGAVEESEARSSAGAADDVRFTYELEGTGGTTSAAAVWVTSVGGSLGTEQDLAATLPFTREIIVPDSAGFDSASFAISGTVGVDGAATDGSTIDGSTIDGGGIVCRILVGTTVVAEQTATGTGASVACTATAEQLRDASE